MQNTEIKALTGIRGLAAFAVMMLHFNLQNFLPEFFHTAVNHGYLAVDLFFILSGFIMTLSYARFFENAPTFKTYKYFLLLRIARVFPLYFICVGITIIGFYLVPAWDHHEIAITAHDIARNLTMTQSWGGSRSYLTPSWSISTEFFAYLLFPALFYLIFKTSATIRKTIILLCMFNLFILAIIPDDFINFRRDDRGVLNIWNEFTFGPLSRCIVEFTLGMLTYHFYKTHKISEIKHFSKLAVGIPVLFIILYLVPGTSVGLALLFMPIIILLTQKDLMISKICASKPIYYLGTISYSLYLLHTMTYWVKPEIFALVEANNIPLEHMVTFILQTGLALMLAMAGYHLIENPARKALRKFISKPV